jgi:hypothetical protein
MHSSRSLARRSPRREYIGLPIPGQRVRPMPEAPRRERRGGLQLPGNATIVPGTRDGGDPDLRRRAATSAQLFRRDEALVRSDGPRRRGGLSLCGSSEAGRPASVSHSDRGSAMPRRKRAMRPGAAQILVATRPNRCARRGEPTRRNALPTNRSPRRVGPIGPIARLFTPERRAVNSRADVGGCRMLRPDVADISRPRLTE